MCLIASVFYHDNKIRFILQGWNILKGFCYSINFSIKITNVLIRNRAIERVRFYLVILLVKPLTSYFIFFGICAKNFSLLNFFIQSSLRDESNFLPINFNNNIN